MTGKHKGSWVNLQYVFSLQVSVACEYKHLSHTMDTRASSKRGQAFRGELVGERLLAGPVMGFSKAQPDIADPWLGNIV